MRADNLKHMIEHIWHNAALGYRILSTDHSVGLSAPSLSIGEHCAIIPGETVLNNAERRFTIHILLVWMFVENPVEPECLVLWALSVTLQRDLVCVLVNYDTLFLVRFRRQERPTADNNFDGFAVGCLDYPFRLRLRFRSKWHFLFMRVKI